MENDKFTFVLCGEIEKQNYCIVGNDLDVLLDKFTKDLSQSYIDEYDEELDDENKEDIKQKLKKIGYWSDNCEGWYMHVHQANVYDR